MPKKIPLVELIRRAENVHGKGRYDYSLINEENYKNTHEKVNIRCNKCGDNFFQDFTHHLRGKGCPNCAKNKKGTTEDFIRRAKEIHGNKYDYSKVNYINANTPVLIGCNECGNIFSQIPSSHLQGHGCSNCSNKITSKARKLDTFIFIKKAKEIHGNKYDYSKVCYVNNHTPILIKCNNCNREFYQIPSSHLQGRGCPYCNKSKGENKISDILKFKNINFIREYRFDDCRDRRSLPFDFYLSDYNICIEYDGEQHYRAIKQFGGKQELNYIQYHDSIKTNYCKQNNIPLLRIRYDEDIELRLNQFLSDKGKIEPQSIFDL